MAADHQLDLLLTYQYPASPGFKKRATSKAAADSMASRAGTLRAEALRAILHIPSTADEVASFLGESVLAIRPRVTELARLGAIIDSGIKRQNISGRNAIVWKAAH